MNYIKRLFSFFLIMLLLSSCGLTQRVYMTPDSKIAVSPRGYTAKNFKNVDAHTKQKIQKRNRTLMVTMIVSANAILFVPLFIGQQSHQYER